MRQPRPTPAARPQKTPDRSPKKVRGTYEVVGGRTVHGAKPGDVVELFLAEAELQHLIEAGHVVLADGKNKVRPGAADLTKE